MSQQLPQIHSWLDTPRGRAVRATEAQLLGEALQDVFGWELVQVGRWGVAHELISAARTRRQIEICAPATPEPGDVVARLGQLPLASDSVDAVVLPHTLEFESDPHGLLREVDRVLTGEGQLLVLGFRPMSLWGLRGAVARQGFPPGLRQMLSERRIRDWLVLLGYDVAPARHYLHEWPWGQPRVSAGGLRRGLLNPLPAGAWLLRARKRVYAVPSIRLRLRERARVIGGLVKPAANRHGE
jgi:SAM-dependent methyltransferase